MTSVTDYAERHGLERLHAADPIAFAAAMTQTQTAGAALPRPSNREDGPASVFRLTPIAK